ncbi:MAG TPA: thioredoxin [Acidimicrobiia bacterium]
MTLVTNVVHGSDADRVLLLVHGFGADERDLGALLPYLDPDGHFLTVLPRGPVAAPPGFAWYDFGADSDASVEQFFASLDALDDLLDDTCREHDMPREQAVVAGFSQGASLVAPLALRASDRTRPAGVLVMSGFLAEYPGLDFDWRAARDVPFLVQHGSEDPLIPVKKGRELARTLEAHELPVIYSEYPMAHQVALEGVQEANEWLDAIRADQRPSAPVPEDPPESLVRSVTTASFDAEVLKSDVPVIVDFWAPWCGPCRQVGPIVEQIAAMRDGAYKVVKVNIDEEPALAQTYNVQSIPLIGLFRDGRLERQSLGAKPRPQLESELGMLVIP